MQASLADLGLDDMELNRSQSKSKKQKEIADQREDPEWYAMKMAAQAEKKREASRNKARESKLDSDANISKFYNETEGHLSVI